MLRLLLTTKIWRRGEFISEEQRAMRFEDAVKIYIYRKTTDEFLLFQSKAFCLLILYENQINITAVHPPVDSEFSTESIGIHNFYCRRGFWGKPRILIEQLMIE